MVRDVAILAKVHMILTEHERGFQVASVEFVRLAETNRSVLPPLPHDRMQEANREAHVLPFLVGLYLLEEVTTDHGRIGTR